MTDVGWLDWLAVVAFAAVTVLAVIRLGWGWRQLPDRGDVVVHAVMGAAMAAMSIPRGGPLPDEMWMAAFAVTALWSGVALVRRSHLVQTQVRPPPAQRSPAVAAHHLAGCVLMVVAFGVGHHDSHDVAAALDAQAPSPSPARPTPTLGDQGDGHDHHALIGDGGALAEGDQLALVPRSVFGAVAGWPIWPLAGGMFLAHGLWAVVGSHHDTTCTCTSTDRRRRLVLGPLPERACVVVMSTGMALMAFTL